MDRNQITGLIVMLVLMTVYFQFFAPEAPENVQENAITSTDSLQSVTGDKVADSSRTVIEGESLSSNNDSLESAIQKERFGFFARFANGREEETVVENEVLKVTFTNLGGQVKSVELKDFKTFDDQPLTLFDGSSFSQNLMLLSNYKPVNITELYYIESTKNKHVKGEDSLTVSYRVNVDNDRYIEHKYTLGGTGYELLYELNLVGLDGLIDNQDAQLVWEDQIKRVEFDLEDARRKTTINYKSVENGFNNLSISDKTESETIDEPIHWFTFNQKFFSVGLIASNGFKKAVLSTTVDKADSSVVKTAKADIGMNIGDLKTGAGQFKYYFGPNNYQITKNVYPGFEENVDLGWQLFRFVNKWLIIPIFNFLENYISSYGVIIIILVFVIRMILAPLTWTSHMSMAKMKVLKPEMDAIKEKNDGDMQKSQGETMELYRKAGINPLSGCIPLLLQFPFLLAMFNFFPNSIELRQEAFLWAHDLSTYDSILDLPFGIPFYGSHVSLFCLLMTVSTILITWSNSQMNTQMQGPMKTMQYLMPIMFLFVLNSYSAGLTFYYFVSNIVSFGQMALFRKLVNEDKIKKVMEENRKKNSNKKKSRFQQKLEEAMKTSQEAQKERQKQKGKKKK